MGGQGARFFKASEGFSSTEQTWDGLGLAAHEEWSTTGAMDALVEWQSEGVGHGGVQVFRLVGIADGALAFGVSLADGLATLDTPTGSRVRPWSMGINLKNRVPHANFEFLGTSAKISL